MTGQICLTRKLFCRYSTTLILRSLKVASQAARNVVSIHSSLVLKRPRARSSHETKRKERSYLIITRVVYCKGSRTLCIHAHVTIVPPRVRKRKRLFLSIKESADPIFLPPYFREGNVRGKKTYTLFRRGVGERIPPRQYYTSCWCFSCFLFSFSFSSASPPPLCATYMGACEMTLLRLINQQSPALASPFIKSYMGGDTLPHT